jgi:fatty-acyl-CoA synthase
MILLTGGTTGLPKGAMLPYRQGFYNAVNTVLSWGLRPDDCAVQATPAFHAAVNALTMPLLHMGARVVLQSAFDPADYLSKVQQHGVTILFLVPTMFHMLAEDPGFRTADLSSVRWAISGGAACPEPVREAYAGRGVRFKQGYGLSEAGVNCFSITLDQAEQRPQSVGKPMLHASAVVRREDGTACGAGEVGELTLAGPHVFSGYFDRPAETAQVLKDGWLWTGDLAAVDDEGFFSIVGRRKEMFVSGGENVYPSEVEAAIYDHPAVAECAVLGVPDPRWGEVGLAAVTLHEGAELSADQLRAFLKERLANYKVPKSIHVLGALPKSAAGKILKTRLASELQGDAV